VNVLSSAFLFALRARIIALTAELGMPAIYQWPETSEEGGLMAYGPRLLGAGLERSRRANWKHGHYSAEAKQVRREARQQFRVLRQLIAAGNEDDVLDLISSM